MQKSYVKAISLFKMAGLISLDKAPTVSILILRNKLDLAMLKAAVHACVTSGALFFVCCGAEAERVEDEVDWMLEDANNDFPLLPTTSHKDSASKDIANFVAHACLLHEVFFRCLIIFDGPEDLEVSSLKAEVDLELSKKFAM